MVQRRADRSNAAFDRMVIELVNPTLVNPNHSADPAGLGDAGSSSRRAVSGRCVQTRRG
jgi:hypothetical protein